MKVKIVRMQTQITLIPEEACRAQRALDTVIDLIKSQELSPLTDAEEDIIVKLQAATAYRIDSYDNKEK